MRPITRAKQAQDSAFGAIAPRVGENSCTARFLLPIQKSQNNAAPLPELTYREAFARVEVNVIDSCGENALACCPVGLGRCFGRRVTRPHSLAKLLKVPAHGENDVYRTKSIEHSSRIHPSVIDFAIKMVVGRPSRSRSGVSAAISPHHRKAVGSNRMVMFQP
jgi:hypothetical protein